MELVHLVLNGRVGMCPRLSFLTYFTHTKSSWRSVDGQGKSVADASDSKMRSNRLTLLRKNDDNNNHGLLSQLVQTLLLQPNM